ncbi:hypothetical protein [Spongiactinospora sp. TRM90649]|uniref:hypothetical protein n=1 Tax=Spongiactinospora sp. TRM90649 TaxID=3031114 RepID=UPI0023F63B00|nr:hypothetical protein [Spongiactinospora sp. TRM90649]MDF5757738.1 hypothetical protein [Spongiactinospora sp. TRM90649]
MSRKSWLWWAAAFVVAAGAATYAQVREKIAFAGTFSYAYCPGDDLSGEFTAVTQLVYGVSPVFRYAGLPVLALALAVHLAAARLGGALQGRIVARVLAALLILVYGVRPLGFAVDMVVDRYCFGYWGGWAGAHLLSTVYLPPLVAALCVLAAVRPPRPPRTVPWYGGRRFAVLRRIVLAGAVLAALVLLPAAGGGPVRQVITEGECDGAKGEPAFVCSVRAANREGWSRASDRAIIAIGRHLCERLTNGGRDVMYRTASDRERFDVAPALPAICPRAAQYQEVLAVEEADERRHANDQEIRACRTAMRHRPRIKPARVRDGRLWTDHGVVETWDSPTEEIPDDIPDDLVRAWPGSIGLVVYSDTVTCVRMETYRRRPPVETEGWDKVVELGYRSLTGDIEFRDMGEPVLPDLAFHGKGDYRLRFHYAEPDFDRAGGLQRLLIMIWAGDDEPARTEYEVRARE